jgi:tRNA (guanosine-2'-O-)-methyltransferase
MTERRREKFERVIAARRPDLTLVLEDIHDPHNVSAVFRSADAVGIPGVHLVYRTDEFPKLGKKSSASASKWVRRTKHSSIRECYDALRADGFTVCATHLGKKAVSIYDLDLTGRVALVFGNEHRGVSQEAADLADVNFRIPMVGMIESLNVSVACAVTLYEAFRQRLAKGQKKLPPKDRKVLKELADEWLSAPPRRKR